jgi:hypothetical protein
MHGVPAADVVVTGAPVYDQWFDRRPSTTRAEFCARVGLDPAKPFFLYLCSSPFIAADEASFVEQWVSGLRSADDPRLRDAGILVRPHPENIQPWQRVDLSQFPNVSIWPRGGANPVDTESKNGYFDSMYHYTSAQIEAGVVGRPVFTIQTDEFARTQEGTLHFHYLLGASGGLVQQAANMAEHLTHLARALEQRPEDADRIRRFVQGFVRPRGLDQPATPQIVDGIEALGALPRPAPERLPIWLYPIRLLLYPLALGLKVARQVGRIARKRERALRPLTVMGFLLQIVFSLLDLIFRWRPAKTFVKRYVVPRVVPRVMAGDSPTEEMVAIPRLLQKMSRSERPIVVGPWLSEVGFEVLYWIPFLNWVRTYRHFNPQRMVVVSRGGAAPWYQDIGAHYIDLFDFFTPEQFRERNEQRMTEGKQKQRSMTDFDRDVLKLVKQSLQAREVEKSQASVNLVEEFAAFQRLPRVDARDLDHVLPDSFVAARFYFNESFPDTEHNRSFVRQLLETIASQTDVVLLNTGLHLDDHWDLRPAVAGRIHTVDHLMTPRNNLEIQTKVISRARSFVGTYGGLSYLAPFYGVGSLAFYSRPDAFSVHHLELARRVFARMRQGSFVVLDTADLDIVRLAYLEAVPAAVQSR